MGPYGVGGDGNFCKNLLSGWTFMAPRLLFPVAKRVIFSGPATIILWDDGTKTVVKCGDGDTFNRETGIALCYMKKALGNKGNYNNTMKRLLKDVK